MKYKLLYIFGLMVGSAATLPAQSALDEYIAYGLENNLMLKERHLELSQALLKLQEARSLFLPSLDLIGNYTTASGGRVIAFPIGDIVNPVYATLNQLTGTQNFGSLENVNEQFLPRNFYDMRFRITYPLLNKNVSANRTIQAEGMKISAHDVEIYRLELIKDIQQAYFNYCIASDAKTIYESASEVVAQNLRVNRSLLENGSGLPAQVLRAESEQEQVRAQLVQAENGLTNARQYLNFLINRPLDTPVAYQRQELPEDLQLMMFEVPSTDGRQELQKLDVAQNINQTVLRMNKNYVVPQLSTFMDFGSQGFDFEFNNQSRYYLFGIQMDMPIYNGNRNKMKIRNTNIEIEKLNNTKTYVQQQLALAAQSSQNQLRTAYTTFSSAIKQEKSAKSYLDLITRGYEEGVNSLIEFIDARNQWTNSKLQKNISFYQVLMAYTDYQRQTNHYEK